MKKNGPTSDFRPSLVDRMESTNNLNRLADTTAISVAVAAWLQHPNGPTQTSSLHFLGACYQRNVVTCGDARKVDKQSLKQVFEMSQILTSSYASYHTILFSGCGFDTFPEHPGSLQPDTAERKMSKKGGSFDRVAQQLKGRRTVAEYLRGYNLPDRLYSWSLTVGDRKDESDFVANCVQEVRPSYICVSTV